ncbi:type II toxin-antitoxin system RelE/ParE family toxin [Gloeocapsopsis sp. IPPAS B-1203]|uniref:type II toxin-antitoxin system RelE/ParE family toxin n=1 Tax=Gloeocapsopsis sp. IPPAS B-1203 TaxID=2049454 RepID=UPI0025A3082B|nr:type II toxin-antitoxin system RelE/ParE family toxin [Gloeocapsopsis sp. IPPAS B-1203]
MKKRYRNIRSDIRPVIEQLQRGELLGDAVVGVEYTIFKVRLRNQDAQRGKSAGYRIIYYIQTANKIILVTIYSKSDQEDVTAEEIRDILKEFER